LPQVVANGSCTESTRMKTRMQEDIPAERTSTEV